MNKLILFTLFSLSLLTLNAECICDRLNFSASGPGFTEIDYMNMKSYFVANLNIGGQGGVVASPDPDTPGGSYYYAWERDAALCMKSFMFLNDFNVPEIRTNMEAYVGWVLRIQNEKNPHNIDTRVEVKFNLPHGGAFMGPWCRPQTDATGLRATTLSLYARALIAGGDSSYVKQYLWTNDPSVNHGGAIKYDLDWVVTNWRQNGCDLWEEIESEDFFWGRLNFRRGLIEGARLAEELGDKTSAALYRKTADEITKALEVHWTGTYVTESSNRPKDAAVVSAFSDGYVEDGVYNPTNYQVAGTVATLNELFCHEYSINQVDSLDGIPGVLYGRYERDIYANGNPWVLLSADLARLFYRGVISLVQGKNVVTDQDYNAWVRAINIDRKLVQGANRDVNLASALLKAGDAVMQRIYHHVKKDGCHLAEQIDRVTGKQLGAADLSWSYATTLVALKYRDQAAAALRQDRRHSEL